MQSFFNRIKTQKSPYLHFIYYIVMKQSALFALLILALISACAFTQKSHDQGHLSRPHPPPVQLDQTIQQNTMDDPFKRPHAPNPKKERAAQQQPKGFPSKEESQQMWNYRSFDQDDQKQTRDQDDQDHQGKYGNFNELLKWGMIIGSVFLIFVLVKTCTKKNGRREMRRRAQEAIQRARINPAQQQMGYYVTQPSPVIINAGQNQFQEQQNLEDKISHAERELNKLKAMQQESLQKEFNKKKMEEEQRRVEAVNAQRKQAFEQTRRQQNNWNVGYGPVFYGQQQGAQIQMQPQQPFQVKGIEPIRQRSNSFKTESSERGMVSQEVNYRNGIPIGKPIRQNDNDSSFASEYPEV